MIKVVMIIAMGWLVASSAGAALVTKSVDYRHGDVTLRGYLAYDDAAGPGRPGVLVIHEWWGLNAYARARTDELARMGFVAFAADIYGDGKTTENTGDAGQWSGEIRKQGILRDRARAGLEVLARQEQVDPERLAAIGFCFGGTTALELAYSGADMAGAVSFHGSLPAPQAAELEKIRAKILVLHGAEDPFVPPEQMEAFQESMRQGKLDWQMISYGGAVHSFSNPSSGKAGIRGVAYNKNAAARSWQHMKLFFDEIFSISPGTE